MSETENSESGQEPYPWADVKAARRNRHLQQEHSIEEARARYTTHAKPCPKCHAVATELSWFYFNSPEWTWEHMCGRAGWMTVCDKCRVQVDFFMEVMN